MPQTQMHAAVDNNHIAGHETCDVERMISISRAEILNAGPSMAEQPEIVRRAQSDCIEKPHDPQQARRLGGCPRGQAPQRIIKGFGWFEHANTSGLFGLNWLEGEHTRIVARRNATPFPLDDDFLAVVVAGRRIPDSNAPTHGPMARQSQNMGRRRFADRFHLAILPHFAGAA